MRRQSKSIFTCILVFLLIITGTTVFAADDQKAAIADYTPGNYDIRQDYVGELGFYFMANTNMTVKEVGVPYFDGNVKTTVFIYEVTAASSIPGQISNNEVKLLTSQQITLAGKGKDSKNFVRAALSKPLDLVEGKQYVITNTTGKIEGDNYIKFYNSGIGASPKAVTSSPEVQILSCAFAFNLDNTKLSLHSQGANFAVDPNVSGVAFGFPNFFYTSSTSAAGSDSESSSESTDSTDEQSPEQTATTAADGENSSDSPAVAETTTTEKEAEDQWGSSDTEGKNNSALIIGGIAGAAILIVGLAIVVTLRRNKK